MNTFKYLKNDAFVKMAKGPSSGEWLCICLKRRHLDRLQKRQLAWRPLRLRIAKRVTPEPRQLTQRYFLDCRGFKNNYDFWTRNVEIRRNRHTTSLFDTPCSVFDIQDKTKVDCMGLMLAVPFELHQQSRFCGVRQMAVSTKVQLASLRNFSEWSLLCFTGVAGCRYLHPRWTFGGKRWCLPWLRLDCRRGCPVTWSLIFDSSFAATVIRLLFSFQTRKY